MVDGSIQNVSNVRGMVNMMHKPNRLTRFISALELHELISLIMIFVMVGLYAMGLPPKQFLVGVHHLIVTAGIIEKSILSCLVLLAILLWIPMRLHRWGSQAKLLFRILASFFVMLVSFEAVVYFIKAKELPTYDEALLKWDQVLFFGKQPAVWMEAIISKPLTTILSTAYLSWFILIFSTIVLMMMYGRKAALEYTTAVLMTFYIGYITYMFVPAFGPLYTYSFGTEVGGLTVMMSERQPHADVFPSLHTATTVVMLIQVWRFCRVWAWLYAPVTVLILMATMYLRLHYGIDVIAGIVLALLVTKMSPMLMWVWTQKRGAAALRYSTESKTAG